MIQLKEMGPSSVQLGNKEVPKASLILEELSSRLLLDQKDWTTKQRFSCGRTFSNSKKFTYIVIYTNVRVTINRDKLSHFTSNYDHIK